MKLIIPWYKLIVQAFKHHNLEKKFVQGILMYHFEKKTLKNLEIFERKKMDIFWKKSLGSPMPLVQRIFFFLKWLKGSIPLVQRLFFFFFYV